MTEDDIRKAANELLGTEGEDWHFTHGCENMLAVIFDHQIPVRKRVEFNLQETKCNPKKRIEEMIDWSPWDARSAEER